MHLQGVVDEIMCKAFPTMLKGPVRIWFSRLMPNSISTFKELSTQFALHFIEGRRYKKSISCLMNIKLREDEMLRFYITRFNKKALSIDEADDKILIAAFTNRLRKGKFLFSLYKNNPKTMSDVLYRETKYINAEDALLAQEEKPKKRERWEDVRLDRGRKMTRTEEWQEDRCSKPPVGKFTSFAPLTALIDQVLMQIKDEKALTFPGKLKGDPNKRSRDKYLRLTGFVPKMAQIDNPVIEFTEEDARHLHHPHDDALIVSIRVRDYNTHQVLVNNGSSADILYYAAFQQIRIDKE